MKMGPRRTPRSSCGFFPAPRCRTPGPDRVRPTVPSRGVAEVRGVPRDRGARDGHDRRAPRADERPAVPGGHVSRERAVLDGGRPLAVDPAAVIRVDVCGERASGHRERVSGQDADGAPAVAPVVPAEGGIDNGGRAAALDGDGPTTGADATLEP